MTLQDHSSLTKSIRPMGRVAVFLALGVLSLVFVREFAGTPSDPDSLPSISAQEKGEGSPAALVPVPRTELVRVQDSGAVGG